MRHCCEAAWLPSSSPTNILEAASPISQAAQAFPDNSPSLQGALDSRGFAGLDNSEVLLITPFPRIEVPDTEKQSDSPDLSTSRSSHNLQQFHRGLFFESQASYKLLLLKSQGPCQHRVLTKTLTAMAMQHSSSRSSFPAGARSLGHLRPAFIAFACLDMLLLLTLPFGATATGEGKRLRKKDPKLTFSFYAQEYLLTGTPTTFFVVPPLDGAAGGALTSFFGAISIIDPAVTETADVNSTEIGRLKGASVFDNSLNRASPDVEALWTVVFNEASGYGEDSTISFRGLYQTLKPARELSISGGTGYFRLARGWAVVTTVLLDIDTGRAINNFTVSVL